MKRFALAVAACAALGLSFLTPQVSADKGGAGSARLNLVEATVAELLKAMQTKLITSEELVEMYLARIEAYEDNGPAVNAFIHINADAATEAFQNDLRRHPGRARRPLEGIPVLLKDNVDTYDMPTTAGSVALEGSIPPDDAFIARKLRKAGAIIIGKATLTEFANFIAIGMPAACICRRRDDPGSRSFRHVRWIGVVSTFFDACKSHVCILRVNDPRRTQCP